MTGKLVALKIKMFYIVGPHGLPYPEPASQRFKRGRLS